MSLNSQNSFDLFNFLSIPFRNKLLIFLISLACSLLAVGYALSLKNIYRSEAMVTTVSMVQQSGGFSSGLSGLASIAGLSIGSSNADKVAYAIETIKSRPFVEKLDLEHDLKKYLLAVDNYDFSSNTLSYDINVFDPDTNNWISKTPNLSDLLVVYRNSLKISRDKQTGLIRLTFDHISPVISQKMLQIIIKELNLFMQMKDRKESENSVNYLKVQLLEPESNSIKNSLNQILQNQLNKLVLSNIRDDYFFEIIEPPFLPDYKNRPNRAVICIFGFILGLIISFSFAYFKERYLELSRE